jgi:hypothetical protein
MHGRPGPHLILTFSYLKSARIPGRFVLYRLLHGVLELEWPKKGSGVARRLAGQSRSMRVWKAVCFRKIWR